MELTGKENLKLTSEKNIKVVARLNVTIAQGARKTTINLITIRDADRFVCPAGHIAIRKAVQGKKKCW
jgi:uncharacterized protein (DUF2345 family)